MFAFFSSACLVMCMDMNRLIFVKDQVVDMVANPRKIVMLVKGWVANKISRYFVEIEKNCYTVHYPYGVRWYRIRIPKVSGPVSHIVKIYCERGIDITEKIKPLLGPSNNFHNQPVSPESLGYRRLTFEFALEPDKIFVDDDTIVL